MGQSEHLAIRISQLQVAFSMNLAMGKREEILNIRAGSEPVIDITE